MVSGLLNGEEINIIINHWSSRREGQKETEHKRVAASNKVGEIISTLKNENENAQIIVMGDFNDNPTSYSVKRLVDGFDLENPMTTLKTYSRGTTRHKRQWFLFDQIFFSKNFLNVEGSSLHFKKADIFDALFLKKSKGKYKGSPFRTYLGPKYQAGYSDHFPVYAVFEVEN